MRNKIVDVKNVSLTMALYDSLLNRSQIVPGMALIHGKSGYGKTTALQYLFNQDNVNGVFVRCNANDTPTSVLDRIAKECGIVPAGRAYKTLDALIEVIRREEFSLFIDEADYVVGNTRIMESFRDIYDNTYQPVVLVGMEEIARRIQNRPQLFNRLSEWVEFKPADVQDVETFAYELMEIDEHIELHDDLLDHIREKSRGVVRTILSALSKVERAINANPPSDGVVTKDDVAGLDLFMTVSRG